MGAILCNGVPYLFDLTHLRLSCHNLAIFFIGFLEKFMSRNRASDIFLPLKAPTLKPTRNKKGLTFVGMLVLLNHFFEFLSAACCKKRIKKKNIPTNVRPFLFREGFRNYLDSIYPSEEVTNEFN